jgi:hypothetical protein
MRSARPLTAPVRFGRRALPALAAATGLVLLAALPWGDIALSEDGRLTISALHAGLGLATLALAVLAPIATHHRAGRDLRIDRPNERRFNCECHLVGVATLILLVASLNLAPVPKAPARLSVTEVLPR